MSGIGRIIRERNLSGIFLRQVKHRTAECNKCGHLGFCENRKLLGNKCLIWRNVNFVKRKQRSGLFAFILNGEREMRDVD